MDKPILYSPWSVQRILARAKTQTRRVIEPQPFVNYKGADKAELEKVLPEAFAAGFADVKAPYSVGDILWVKEPWALPRDLDHLNATQMLDASTPVSLEILKGMVEYKADGYRADIGRPRHARFMPRWASRITLTVTRVRVERLQDISEEDAQAEGCNRLEIVVDDIHAIESGELSEEVKGLVRSFGPGIFPAKLEYRQLWDSLHGIGAWARNPWVWVYEFGVITTKREK